MRCSSSSVAGRGRAESLRRWWSWEGVIVSVGESEERSVRIDQVGFERMSLGEGFGAVALVANAARGL